jgi:hypothetical protein
MKEHVIGECFNPWRQACGFYAPDIVGKQRTLVDDKGKSRTITDGQKRLLERLMRFAGQQGKCWQSQRTLATVLGKCERQIRADLDCLEAVGLIKRERKRAKNAFARHTIYLFLWHPIYESERQYGAVPTGSVTDLDDNQNGSAVPFQDEPTEIRTAVSNNQNGSIAQSERQSTAAKASQELCKGISSSSSGSSKVATAAEEEEEFPSLSQTETQSQNQNPEAVAIVHSEQDIEQLGNFLQAFRDKQKDWADPEPLPPTPAFVRECTDKAPGWTVTQIAAALTINTEEAVCKPKAYRWFIPVIANLYAKRNGIPPEPPRPVRGPYRSWDEHVRMENAEPKPEPKCSHCRDSGEYPKGEDCHYRCEAGKERANQRKFESQSKRWQVIYAEHKRAGLAGELDFSPAGTAFHLGKLDERENILQQLEAGVPFSQVVAPGNSEAGWTTRAEATQ